MKKLTWTQIDGFGSVVRKFTGSFEELCVDVLGTSPSPGHIRDVADIRHLYDQKVWLSTESIVVVCYMVKFSTPWGEYRYIANLDGHVRRASSSNPWRVATLVVAAIVLAAAVLDALPT